MKMHWVTLVWQEYMGKKREEQCEENSKINEATWIIYWYKLRIQFGFWKEEENCHKKPSMVSWTTHSLVTHYRKPGKVCPLGGESDGRGAKRLQVQPCFYSSFLGLSHAGLSGLPRYIPPALPSHHLPVHTKYIYYPTVCCRWAPLAAFPLLGRVQEARRREEKRKRNQSKQFCLPAGSWLQE